MKFSDFSVAKKLGIGFGAVVVVIVAGFSVIYVETRSLAEVERLNSTSDDAVDDLDKAKADVSHVQSLVRKLMLTRSAADRAKIDKESKAYSVDIGAVRAILAKDAPDLLPKLDAYEKAATLYVGTTLANEARLASSPDTRAQAMEIEATGQGQAEIDSLNGSFDAARADIDRWSDSWTSAGEAPRAPAMRGACKPAFSGDTSGSSPEPDWVTASAGMSPADSLRRADASAAMRVASLASIGPRLLPEEAVAS